MAVCVFCGAEGKLHKEDVIPRWTAPFLAASQNPRDPADAGSRAGNITHTWESPDERVAPSYSRTARRPAVEAAVVCQANCNGGWMSRLEGRAKPILGPMITGNATELSVSDQETLASWAVKTALMFHLARPAATQPRVDATIYRRFAQHPRPPFGTKVLLGATQRGPAVWESSSRETTSAGGGPELPAVITTMALGNVLFAMVLLTPEQSPTVGVLQARFAGPFSQIWPTKREIRWPSHPPLDGSELRPERIADLLSGKG